MSHYRIVVLAGLLAGSGGAATITVTTTADDAIANGNCTLREAVQAAQTDLAVDACTAGSAMEADVIELAGDHLLELGEIAVPGGSGPLIVRGTSSAPLATVRTPGAAPTRLFDVATGADLTLEALELRDGAHGQAGGAVRALQANLTARNVTFAASSAPAGGALSYTASGRRALRLEGCRFLANAASGPVGDGTGGGARIFVSGGATARIADTLFLGNDAVTASQTGNAIGGALHLSVGTSSSLEVLRSTFLSNRVEPGAGGGGLGSGAYATVGGAGARLTFVDSAFEGNGVGQLTATEYTGAVHAVAASGAELALDRLRLVGNDSGQPWRHLVMTAVDGATVAATNLLLADGPATGLSLECFSSSCGVGHATITGHATRAGWLMAEDGGEARLENSVLWQGHGVVTFGAATVDPSTLAGIDPLFTAPASGDYTLAAGSPAIDFGDVTLASMRRLDAAHAPRIAGGTTDAGAFERDALFGDGFESADTSAWSASPP